LQFPVESQGAAGCLIYHIQRFNRINYNRISSNKQPYFETENKLKNFCMTFRATVTRSCSSEGVLLLPVSGSIRFLCSKSGKRTLRRTSRL